MTRFPSQRPPLDRARIENFLAALGHRFHHPLRLYLVGGTTLVYEGLREQTIDIDLDFEVDNRYHGELVRIVRALKDELQVNVEEVSPAHFIPMPAGTAERARFIGKYGSVDVFHFDPYAMALSKIDRGRDEDLDDVVAMLAAGWLTWPMLSQLASEVLPRFETESLKADPDRFLRHLGWLEARLGLAS